MRNLIWYGNNISNMKLKLEMRCSISKAISELLDLDMKSRA